MTRTLFGRVSALALVLALGACASSKQSADRASVEIRGTDPNAAAAGLPPPPSSGAPVPAAAAAQVAAGGSVIDYGDYRVAVASDGDTVETVANRIGMPAAELAAYNGLQPTSQLYSGDELVVPENAQLAVAAVSPGTAPAAPAPTGEVPLELAGTAPAPSSVEAQPLDGSGGTAPASASDGGWSPDLAAAAIDRTDTGASPVPPPPSAGDPVPPAPEEPNDLVPADLGAYQSPTSLATPFQLTRPVEGTVAIPYSLAAGEDRNEGVDFAAPAGAPVVAAEDGEVALVSESLGGLGTIVLIRHPDDVLTVYGRLANVTVEKGDYLERGQRFGEVADAPAGTEPRMHFEVRRGADSIDPMTML